MSAERAGYFGHSLGCSTLYAFRIFGYGLILNAPLHKVREQIIAPDTRVLPGEWLVPVPEESFDTIGFQVIEEPALCRSLLVTIVLKTPRRRVSYGVVLPALTPLSTGIYLAVQQTFQEPQRLTLRRTVVHHDVLETPEDMYFSPVIR